MIHANTTIDISKLKHTFFICIRILTANIFLLYSVITVSVNQTGIEPFGVVFKFGGLCKNNSAPLFRSVFLHLLAIVNIAELRSFCIAKKYLHC